MRSFIRHKEDYEKDMIEQTHHELNRKNTQLISLSIILKDLHLFFKSLLNKVFDKLLLNCKSCG
jgi:hypothetical protein